MTQQDTALPTLTGQPDSWQFDDRMPAGWWRTRDGVKEALGYRRWCPSCARMRTPRMDFRFSAWRILRRQTGSYHACPGCWYRWDSEPYSGTVHLDDDGMLVFYLHATHWWVRDQVTLEALRICPDVRGAADLIWRRLEQRGRYMEAEATTP